ncbi:hypothetical protein C1645_780825 [Glomus cerebriforme]|uniref:Uncharacterized protein n=1 Tax=Glomus cerebriforme TaxID=658196 RepID=A0A397SIC6_9GLOM|nr:hypothetical protein C1645_780825 [Glomus cerebriforme]
MSFTILPTSNNILKNTTISSVNSLSSQQTINSTPFHSFYMGNDDTGLSKYIDLRDYENDVETNLSSDIPRIIDLSTGESLESIPSVEQLQKNRKPKRSIEIVENQDELSSILGIMEENKEDNENSIHSHKRIRTTKEHMCNFIEEEEQIDPRVHFDIMKEFKIGSNTFCSNKANSLNSTEDPSQSLSLYFRGKDSSNVKFTVPYQEAIVRYMRLQIQHLNNDEIYKNEGKKLILYHPKIGGFKDDSSCKIFEIPETMDLDVEAGQNGAVNCTNDSHYAEDDDQMDID